MSSRYFSLNDAPSTDFGVYVSDADTYDAPTRDVEAVEVPGRNGCLYIDNGRYEPIAATYECYMKGFGENIEGFKDWLYSCAGAGEAILTDSAHEGEYRIAKALSSFTVPSVSNSLDAATLKVSFECGPERWLDEGQEETELSASGGSVSNPTGYEAKPLLSVSGYGTLQVGDTTIIIAENDYTYIYIDCEMMDCYATDGGTINCNSLVSLSDFPTLGDGETAVVWDDTITYVSIVPRWWRL